MIRFGTPHDLFDVVIGLCWVTFLVVWLASAMFVKRTVERSFGWARLLVLVILFAFAGMSHWAPWLQRVMWPRTAAIGSAAASLTIAGLAVAVWARATLGGNWSGAIALKEGHELIQRGPYAHVRHPIYSGVLLMCLGTAVAAARPAGFVVLAVTAVLLVLKARDEEQLMIRHFPDAYPGYRERVKALIPGIW